MDLKARRSRASDAVDRRAADLDRLALAIHARPEVAFEERASSALIADRVAAEGVPVTRGAGGLETAFVAEIGAGSPVVALCAEYDALPDIGHACGHNLMGVGAAGAFLALRDALEGLAGTVRLIGCPAEERGGGKTRLIEAGVFTGVDAAMMFHAGERDEIDPLMPGVVTFEVELQGHASHASAAPWEGRNALDALISGWNAMAALRLVVRSDTRLHGVITDGGSAPNVIPERAAAVVAVRSPDNAYLEETRARVIACFEGGARAAGCELRVAPRDRHDALTTSAPLAAAFAENARALGRPMSPRRGPTNRGSTDMGDVSTAVPSIHPILAIADAPLAIHTRAFAAAAATPRALATMRIGAKALAMTALDVLSDPELARAMSSQHHVRR